MSVPEAERWDGHRWLGPEVVLALILTPWLAIVYISRDFGVFLLSLLVCPLLLALVIGCGTWSLSQRRGARSMPLAILITLAVLPVADAAQRAWDWAEVAIWVSGHREIVSAA